jgi:hypothetical protein
MLCLIPLVGGLLIMMGQHDRSEALFYYFPAMRPVFAVQCWLLLEG